VPVRVSIAHTDGRRQHVVTVTGSYHPPVVRIFEAAGMAGLLEPDRRREPGP